MRKSITTPCTRCGSFGQLPISASTLVRCPTCAGTGELIFENLKGDVNHLKWGDLHLHLDDVIDDGKILAKVYAEMKAYYQGADWFAVHAEYPWLAEVEEELFRQDKINIEEIPGGPLKPEVGMATDNSKPYRAYRDKIKQATSTAPREETRVVAEPASKKKTQATVTEEQTMSKASTSEKLRDGGRRVINNVQTGVAMGMVTGANRTAIGMVRQQLGEKYPELLQTPAGEKAMELALPSLVLMLCAFDEDNRIPRKEYIERAAELAVQGTTSEGIQELTAFLFQHAGMILSSYAEAGRMIEEQPDTTWDFGEEDEHEEEPAPSVEEAEELFAS